MTSATARIASLTQYPIKSCGGMVLEEAEVECASRGRTRSLRRVLLEKCHDLLDLAESGILHSLSMVSLGMALQRDFNVALHTNDLNEETLGLVFRRIVRRWVR